MNTLFFKLPDLSLVIIPEARAHLDGHPIITYTYRLFVNRGSDGPVPMEALDPGLQVDLNNEADYYGKITFKLPDKLFNYISRGGKELNSEQVEQVIEFLSNVRSNPGLWNLDQF